ncbi:MAG: hypothetical protein WBH42_09195 [Bacillota bacterium]|jgi:hypothetical protein
MSNLMRLVAGELKRLVKYNILPVSLVTAVIWIVLFLFQSANEARNIAPLLFTLPSILYTFGAIDPKYEWLLMLSPSHSASHLITSVVRGEFKVAMVVVGCLYLAVLTATLFRFVVYPQFRDNAARG